MPELRWALFGLGALFIVGLALWEWRRSRRRHAQSAAEIVVPVTPQGVPARPDDWSRRVEPRIDSMLGGRADAPLPEFTAIDDVPVIHPSEPVSVRVARESAVDLPSALRPPQPEPVSLPDALLDERLPGEPLLEDPLPPAALEPLADPDPEAEFDSVATQDVPTPQAVAIRWPPERADRVLTLRVVHPQGTPLLGRDVRLALEQGGMVPGPQTIYHRVGTGGAVLASAANLVRPGDLDPQAMDDQQLRGLSMFSVLPGAMPPVRMLEELVAIARAVAWRLGAIVQDDQGRELDGESLVRLRQSLPDAPGD